MSFQHEPSTHYDTLGIRRSASFEEIKKAYHKIVRSNHPDKTRNLGPFARARAQKITMDANAAWEVLSDVATKQKYDSTLPFDDLFSDNCYSSKSPNIRSFNPHAKRTPAASSSQPKPTNESNKGASGSTPPPKAANFNAGDDSRSSNDADFSSGSSDSDTDTAPTYEEAAYRYMHTTTGTVIDISISGWRLHLNLSPTFRFLNDITERSALNDTDDTVSFEMGLVRDLNSAEIHEATITEVTLKVMEIPGRMRIDHIQTLFTECSSGAPTLAVTLTAEPCMLYERDVPWEFGFDFDKNQSILARDRGTCMTFSRDEPPAYMQTYGGPDSPDYVLKKNKRLKADAFAELYAERLLKLKYGDVEMWRVAAVGFKRQRR